jgi:hypothetical protein
MAQRQNVRRRHLKSALQWQTGSQVAATCYQFDLDYGKRIGLFRGELRKTFMIYDWGTDFRQGELLLAGVFFTAC